MSATGNSCKKYLESLLALSQKIKKDTKYDT